MFWALLVVIGGMVLRLSGTSIGLLALLPLAAVGLITLLSADAVIPINAVPLPTVKLPGVLLERTARELERAAGTLEALTIRQKNDSGEQSRLIQQSTRLLDEFNTLADRARREVVVLAASSSKTRSITQSGRDSISEAIESMNYTRVQVEQIVATLMLLARHVQRINQIVAAVAEIGTQANFLALNAAIEAARAGSHGRSFTTVADEVRALAEQSQKAAAQIRDVLAEIHKAMEKTVDSTEAGAQAVQQGITLTRQAESAIAQLSSALEASTAAVQKITAAVDHQAGNLEQMVQSVDNVGRVTLQAQAGLQMAESVAQDLSRLSRELVQSPAQEAG